MGTVIRVTKRFSFEAAHLLTNHDHECRFIHGHSYKLFVTVIGRPCQKHGHPKLGMVIDFKDLKKVVQEQIINVYDHALLLEKNFFRRSGEGQNMLENMKIVAVDFQTTCENLLLAFAKRIKSGLEATSASLHSLKLYETEDSYAEWFAADQDEKRPC